MRDYWNAFVDEKLTVKPLSEGRLQGKTFAVKDVFAIKGVASGAGNPDWLRTHGPSADHAPSILRLLAQGAELRGTTHTDELMFSLNGENAHYGTPINPRAVDRIPGGSSSGSAVAVAAGIVDFALGTDTGGSVRVPSSYCGIYGMRPTHNAVTLEGVIPLAPGFDTVGWMARDAATLLEVGKVLLDRLDPNGPVAADNGIVEGNFSRGYYWPIEAWDLADETCRTQLETALEAAEPLLGLGRKASISPEGLAEWMTAFRMIQGTEIGEIHRDWIERTGPAFGPGIAERFQWALSLKREDLGRWETLRDNVRRRLDNMLRGADVMLLPTVPGGAPLKGLSGTELERRRSFTMQLTCIAGLAGLPQVTLPLTGRDGLPLGLSIIGAAGSDLQLLQLAVRLEKRLHGVFGEGEME